MLIEKNIARYEFVYYYSREYDIKAKFYLYSEDENVFFTYKQKRYYGADIVGLLESDEIKTVIEKANKQKAIYKEKNIAINTNMYSYGLIDTIDLNKLREEILDEINVELDKKIDSTDDLIKLKQLEWEYNELLSSYSRINEQKQKLKDRANVIIEKEIAVISSFEDCNKVKNKIETSELITEKEKYIINVVEKMLTKMHSDEDCTKALEIISESQSITDKSKYIETVRNVKAIKNEEEIKEREKNISKIEEQIRDKEIYLESLYHGHICPVALVLLGIVLVIGVVLLLLRDPYDLGLAFGSLMIGYGVIGLIISGICGRPSTRPAIPKKKEIQDLKEELNRIKSGEKITTQTTEISSNG